MQAVDGIPARGEEGERRGLGRYFCRPVRAMRRVARGEGCFRKMCPGPGLAWMGPQVRAVGWGWGASRAESASKAKAGDENQQNACGLESFS